MNTDTFCDIILVTPINTLHLYLASAESLTDKSSWLETFRM